MTQVIDIAGASPEKASSDNAAFYYPVQLGQCLSVLLHKKCQESLALEGLAYLFLASWHQRNIMFGHSCCALLPLGILSILFQSQVGYFVRTLFVCAGLPPSVGAAWLRLRPLVLGPVCEIDGVSLSLGTLTFVEGDSGRLYILLLLSIWSSVKQCLFIVWLASQLWQDRKATPTRPRNIPPACRKPQNGWNEVQNCFMGMLEWS